MPRSQELETVAAVLSKVNTADAASSSDYGLLARLILRLANTPGQAHTEVQHPQKQPAAAVFVPPEVLFTTFGEPACPEPDQRAAAEQYWQLLRR